MEEKISNEMFALAERLKELRDAKSASEQKTKDINAELDEVEQELAQMMVDTETQNFTRGGTMFSLTNKTRASAVADSKAKLYRALKRKGHGDLVYETVNANSQSVFVNEQIAVGSLKGFTRYLMRILPKYKNSNAVVTRFTLKKATSGTGIAYSQAQFAVARVLSPEEHALIAGMTEQVKAMSAHVGYDNEDTVPPNVDPETGEIIAPLN